MTDNLSQVVERLRAAAGKHIGFRRFQDADRIYVRRDDIRTILDALESLKASQRASALDELGALDGELLAAEGRREPARDSLGRSDADLLRLIAKDHARLAPNAYHSAETLREIAGRLDAIEARGKQEMIPREPTQEMMNAGLYHCSADMTWADLHTAYKAMFDAVALDGGCTAELPAAPRPDRTAEAGDAFEHWITTLPIGGRILIEDAFLAGFEAARSRRADVEATNAEEQEAVQGCPCEAAGQHISTCQQHGNPFALQARHVDVVEEGEECTLVECPPGLFRWGDALGFKTEYGAMRLATPSDIPGDQLRWTVGNWPDAYVVASGEYFWGGTKTQEERAALIVQPLAYPAVETGKR